MRARAAALLALFALLPAIALSAEGGAMLSQDDLGALQGAYETFLGALEDVLIEKELLREEERDRWYEAQLGDYFANGGYGSILITYQPGSLDYVREEEMAAALSCGLPNGTLELSTMRRYTPGAGEEGLRLAFSAKDRFGMPVACTMQLSSTEGIFSRWDPLTGQYASVGTAAVTQGEAMLWMAPSPAPDAADPVIAVRLYLEEDGSEWGAATLTLRVSEGSYLLDGDALAASE